MEGLDGPTPDQPFMTPAHRRGSVFTFSGPVGRTLSEEISPCGWLDPPIVIKKHVQPAGHADTPHAHLV
jgi:hypothetical protein